ncbi:hypothetical protein SPRA44_350126 [Serratia proteamaculans]|nr:hypothetical protein SPRA44_350126 [Serratia proteamaculans]
MDGICNTLDVFKLSAIVLFYYSICHIPPILDVKIPTEGNPAGYL